MAQCKIISIFNHKGGVGKTTSTIGLGWKLAEQGHRVLLIDADPQCNLTGFLVDPALELITANEHNELLPDALEQFYLQFPRANIRSSLAPLLASDEVLQELNVPRNNGLLAEVFPVPQRNNFLPNNIPPFSQPPANLFLLAGHPFFYEYDSSIALATTNPDAYATAQDVPGCFFALFTLLAQTHQLDYIIVDLSPSASTTNKLIIMSSHFTIVPCSPDFFSHMAIRSLATMLPQWDDWKARLATNLIGRNLMYHLPERKPIFLGHTIQLYTLTSKGTGEPAAAYQRWIDRINETVRALVIPALERRGMAFPVNTYGNPSHIVRLRNYQSVGPAASKCHIPVFAMTNYLLKRADASSGMNIIEEVQNTFDEFADTCHGRWDSLTHVQKDFIEGLQRAYHTCQRFNIQNLDLMNSTQVIQLANQLNHLLGQNQAKK